MALPASVFGVGLGMRAVDEASTTGEEGGGASQTVDIELGDLLMRPSSIEVAAGTDLTARVTNNGAMAHDLKLNGETGN